MKYSSQVDTRPGTISATYNGFNVIKIGKKVYSLQLGKWIRIRRCH